MVTEKMKPDECEAVSALIADAFYSKFRLKVKLSKRELQTIISRIWLGEADNLGLSLWTVKKNGHIVGAYGLSEYVETQITPSLIGKLTAVIKHLGLLRFFKFIKILIETNHRLGRNELYIDFIAVKEGNRNQNIGHFIMENIIERSAEIETIQTVSLFVLKENDHARHLYEKFGFTQSQDVKSRKYDFLVRKLKK